MSDAHVQITVECLTILYRHLADHWQHLGICHFSYVFDMDPCSLRPPLISFRNIVIIFILIVMLFHQSARGEELAFGDTPAYSVSKAALNALTRIMAHKEGVNGVKILAVCPGDVDTKMCFLPEGSKILTPLEAARDVLWVGLSHESCRTGHFYRARQQIPW